MARELYECPKCGSVFYSRKVRTAHKVLCMMSVDEKKDKYKNVVDMHAAADIIPAKKSKRRPMLRLPILN